MRSAIDLFRPLSPSSEAYLYLHSSNALEGYDLLCSLFTCTNANQAATCTCNSRPRVSLDHVVDHSSHQGVTIHWSSDARVLKHASSEFIFSIDVGDSHEGPLKTGGGILLKTCKKHKRKTNLGPNTKYTHNTIHVVVAPAAHRSGPAKHPLERGPPRSRAHAALE
jgi:hypothetical protein